MRPDGPLPLRGGPVVTRGEAAGDVVPLGSAQRRLTTLIDGVLVVATGAIVLAWIVGRPILYSPSAPVTSPFTAFSLLILVLVRLARAHAEEWPATLNFAMTGLVLGGNVSSILMLALMPPELLRSFTGIVLTSTMTSIGLVLFCLYDLVIVFRETPESAFILDDILLHLALVPGGLSLLGYLLSNPTYLSIHADPRVGISPLEMALMALYATSAVLSNPRLFLWRFLAAGWTNRLVFAGLFANQFVAPVVVAFVLSAPGAKGPGIELFVMLAGVVTTIAFLLLQARTARRPAG
jgi:hypothetical protein